MLAFQLMIASQGVAACIEFLKATQPRAIVTEYDRNHKSSCLVLAARALGVPTITLVHGLMHSDALLFSPVLADKIICWGELDRAKLLAAGEPPGKVLVGGCPRFSRDFHVSSAEARAKLGLSQDKPIVLFASTNEAQRCDYANLFCEGIEKLETVSGVVRLHPSENLNAYCAVIDRHPGILFLENEASTLDELVAAADVIVVHGSGVGNDALIKRRPVVLLDREAVPHGVCSDLATQAGCPHARTPEELAYMLSRLIHDAQYRQRLSHTAEIFVDKFCKAFGQDSAELIAGIVRQQADQVSPFGHE